MSIFYKDIRTTLFGIDSVMVDNDLLNKSIESDSSYIEENYSDIKTSEYSVVEDNKSEDITIEVKNTEDKDIKKENKVEENLYEVAQKTAMSNGDKFLKNKQINDLVQKCNKCSISSNVTKKVYGGGNLNADLFIIGDVPNSIEYEAGNPFLGETGELLNRMLKAMGISREDVYLTNVLKCIVPEDRDATKEESANCLAYLKDQIQIVNPKVLLVFGSNALNSLITSYNSYHEQVEDLSVAKLNGTYLDYYGYKVMPTYALDFLIRNPKFKKDTWEALQIVMKDLGLNKPE